MDGRANNGGHSTKGKAGRKSKSDEQKMIERLTPLTDIAYNALKSQIEEEESWAVKLFFEYMYGKPKASVDLTSDGDKFEGFNVRIIRNREDLENNDNQ